MQGKTKQGFVLSILLHVGVVVGVILFTFLKPLEKPKPMVFELVAPPPASADVPSPQPALDFSAPSEPIPLPEPKVEPPPPKPTPKPPEPKPPEPKPKPVEKPKPVVKPPEPKPKEVPKPMSIEEFRKLNPQKPKPKTTTPPKPTQFKRVDTSFKVNLRESVVNVDSLAGLSQIQQSELQNYIARLREALRLCWAKPGGLPPATAADVEFRVSPNGSFSGIRIVRTSGNTMFDASVLESFDALGTGGQTPDGKPLHLRYTFRINED